MKAEKFIKDEAKSILGSGNWLKAVAAVLTVCFIPLIGVCITEIAYSIVGGDSELSVEVLTSSPYEGIFFILFQIVAIVAMLMLSPLACGGIRVFCSLAEDKSADMSDIFYFFEFKRRYTDTVKFMTGITVRGIITFLLSVIPALLAYVAYSFAYRETFARSDDFSEINILNAAAVILLIVGIIFAFCFIHRYLFSLYLYCKHDYGEKDSMVTGAKLSKRFFKNLIMLTLSFIPWILLLFFVVPFLYVFPYMACAYAVSVKYLINAYGINLENAQENAPKESTEKSGEDLNEAPSFFYGESVTEFKNNAEETVANTFSYDEAEKGEVEEANKVIDSVLTSSDTELEGDNNAEAPVTEKSSDTSEEFNGQAQPDTPQENTGVPNMGEELKKHSEIFGRIGELQNSVEHESNYGGEIQE